MMRICIQAMYEYPFGEAAVKVNVWLVPLPAGGVTETFDGG